MIVSQIALAYVPCPNDEQATLIARRLLEKKLIACANIFPIRSIYEWQGKIEEEAEVVLLAKTTPELFLALRAEVEAIHPYDTPCVLRLSGEANEKYFSWLTGVVSRGL
jgi:periplasmic divalent cation tolerance protein